MKKLVLLLIIFSSLRLAAQTATATTAFSAGFELAIPTHSAYNIGYGASAKLEVPVAQPVSLTLTGGFTSLHYKSNFFDSSYTPGAATFVPLKAGIKFYPSQGFYAEAEAGAAIETNYGRQSSFAFSIGPGFIFPLNDKSGIDLGFRYENWSNQLSQTGIRVAYRFGL